MPGLGTGGGNGVGHWQTRGEETEAAQVRSLLRRIAHQLPLLDAKRAGIELYGAPRLNSFVLFDPNENTLSRLVADLLDPQGTHGQGTVFLNAFLTSLRLPRVGPNDPVRVRREAPTAEGRRIDLVIETPRLLLGIENKPWAGQRPTQLRDYLDALNSWARARKVALVFLSGQEPETAKGEVLVLPFVGEDEPTLASFLKLALREVRAARTRTHVEEFIDYIEWQFGDGDVNDESDSTYLDAIEAEFETPQHRRSIAAVLLTQDRLHARVLDEIGDHLVKVMAAAMNDFELAEEGKLSEALAQKETTWGLRRRSWPENLAVAIEADSNGFGGMFYGVQAPDPDDAEVRKEGSGCAARPMVEPALRSFGGGGRTRWWPWWKWATTRTWGPAFTAGLVLHSPTGHVEDHPDIVELGRVLLELAQAVDWALTSP